jgi:hypothetical protein
VLLWSLRMILTYSSISIEILQSYNFLHSRDIQGQGKVISVFARSGGT